MLRGMGEQMINGFECRCSCLAWKVWLLTIFIIHIVFRYLQIIKSAEHFSQTNMVRFWKVSALECKQVKRMFREMINTVKSNSILWHVDEPQNAGGDEEGGDEKGNCTLQ